MLKAFVGKKSYVTEKIDLSEKPEITPGKKVLVTKILFFFP